VNIREKLKVQGTVEETQTYQKNWKKHAEQMQDERLPKLTFKQKPVGKQNRRHPRKRWKDKFLEKG
jgi:hypothetical protein